MVPAPVGAGGSVIIFDGNIISRNIIFINNGRHIIISINNIDNIIIIDNDNHDNDNHDNDSYIIIISNDNDNVIITSDNDNASSINTSAHITSVH